MYSTFVSHSPALAHSEHFDCRDRERARGGGGGQRRRWLHLGDLLPRPSFLCTLPTLSTLYQRHIREERGRRTRGRRRVSAHMSVPADHLPLHLEDGVAILLEDLDSLFRKKRRRGGEGE
jgi:hypothetical protein